MSLIWWIVGGVTACFVGRAAWRAYTDPAHTLGRQGANMNWVTSRFVRDSTGVRSMCLTRDGLEVMIRYRPAGVVLLTPAHPTPFTDFIELERWLARSEKQPPKVAEGGGVKSFTDAIAWESFLSQPDVPEDLEAVVRTVFIPEAVKVMSFLDNYAFLLSGGMITTSGEPSPTPTESALSLRRPMDRPPGMPLWFLAAFPDVANWTAETMGQAQLWQEPAAMAAVKRLDTMRAELNETDLGDVNGQLAPKHAAVLVRWFRETTNRRLECGTR